MIYRHDTSAECRASGSPLDKRSRFLESIKSQCESQGSVDFLEFGEADVTGEFT